MIINIHTGRITLSDGSHIYDVLLRGGEQGNLHLHANSQKDADALGDAIASAIEIHTPHSTERTYNY